MLKNIPKEIIIKQMAEKLKNDVMVGSGEYRHLMRELERTALASDYTAYDMALVRLNNLRYIDQSKMEYFAEFLQNKSEQKHVFLFYQQESIPVIESSQSPGAMGTEELVRRLGVEGDPVPDFRLRDTSFNTKKIKQIFSDSSISIHFIYITKNLSDGIDVNNRSSRENMRFEDKSEGIFQAFKEIAEATGGLTDSSARIDIAFERAVAASENYYLLYYSPQNYSSDGKFKKIKVKVKNKRYRITHRAGYIAD